jgi:hypothetical protein
MGRLLGCCPSARKINPEATSLSRLRTASGGSSVGKAVVTVWV